MIKEIVKLVFLQAAEETPNVSKTGLSKHISKKIEENNSRKIFSYKTFTRYYDKYILGKEGIIEHPQAEIIEELCKYLGYENYQDFVSRLKVNYKEIFFVSELTDIQDINVSPVLKTVKPKDLSDNFLLNKNLIKQVVLTVILIMCFQINWTDKECLFCVDDYGVKPKTQSIMYHNILSEDTKKVLDTTYDFYKMKNICYGGKKRKRSF